MGNAPKWFRPVAVVALLWNLLGCAAYLSDVTLTSEDVAQMSPEQQALYEARPAWAVGATAIAVWCGALGCLGLILRKRWSLFLLVLSLLGVIVQDVALFGLNEALEHVGVAPIVMQGVVLVVSVALVLLASKARKQAWVT